MNKKNIFVFLGLAGLLATLFFLPNSVMDFVFNGSKDSDRGATLIKDIYGSVQKKSPTSAQLVDITKNSPLNSGDILYTHTDSKVLLGFKTPFWLMPHSKMEFIKQKNQWVAQLVYGELKKLPEATDDASPTIELLYSSQTITSDTFTSYEFEPIDIDVKTSDFKDLSAGSNQPQNVLEKQIFETLGLHKKFFEGCFIRHYKKTKGQFGSGETVFEITIDVTGIISNTRIVRSEITDETYTKCLKTVLDRVRFRNLPLKEPMRALFPLSIDTP